MRFLFSSSIPAHWGGSEWLWTETALRLNQAGHRVAFVTPFKREHAMFAAMRRAGLDEYAGLKPERWFRRWPRKWLDRRPFPERVLDQSQPDFFVFSQGRQDEGAEWHPLLRERRIPYVVLNQQVCDTLYLADDIADQLVNWFSGARRVCFVSQANQGLCEMQLGVRLPQSSIIWNPNRASRDAILPWPTEATLRLAMVGRLDPEQKGHDLMLAVLARDPWRGRAIALHIYGDGSSLRRLTRAAEMLSLTNVFFHPYSPDLAKIWSENHVAALPSRHEGLPVSMIEAMFYGRPVFAAAVAGIPELVTDEVEGFLAAGATVDLLDASLHRLWARRGDLAGMGTAARARVLRQAPLDPVGDFAQLLLAAAGTPPPS